MSASTPHILTYRRGFVKRKMLVFCALPTIPKRETVRQQSRMEMACRICIQFSIMRL